jgi:hypothetical protein
VGRSIPIAVGDRKFASKGDAVEFFREMLNRYRPGDHVSDPDAVDLKNLLQLHTEAERKIGTGIHHFEVMDGGFGTQCFKVVRTDGSSDDFSYGHCITPKKS